jgi:hypothetical protein
MTGSTARHETTGESSTFNILIALDNEAQFLYPKIDPYRSDAEKANRSDLVNMRNTIKHERQRHMQTLRRSQTESGRRTVEQIISYN